MTWYLTLVLFLYENGSIYTKIVKQRASIQIGVAAVSADYSRLF